MRGATVAAVVAVAVLAGLSGFASRAASADETREGDPILRVGTVQEMVTTNPLASTVASFWTEAVLGRVYGSVLLPHQTLDGPMAYIAKGIDADEDGTFEPALEYDVWSEGPAPATPLVVTAYYDFNGVRWHDGVPVTVWDLLFSYHLGAMHPSLNTSLRVLFCDPNATYDACGRQLGVGITAKNWDGEGGIAGDPALRVAVAFSLNEPYARFAARTLGPRLFPMHVWSHTGGARHGDFGCAVWIPPTEAAAKGLSACATTDGAKRGRGIGPGETVTGSHPYELWGDSGAMRWDPANGMIGHGPFRFVGWVRGAQVDLVRNDDYYRGLDVVSGTVFDGRLSSRLPLPRIGGITFLTFKWTGDAVMALRDGSVDYLLDPIPAYWTISPPWIPEIAYESNAAPGFAYLAYNMRRQPWGYVGGNPANGDAGMGYWLRQAISHLVDKKSIVQNLLQNFGVIGYGTVSPANTFWYNDNIPKPDLNATRANAILDDMATSGGAIPQIAGFTLDPLGACYKDTPAGCRSLPTIGNVAFDILTPRADHDPVRASAGSMVADAMRRVGLNANTMFSSWDPFPDPGEIVQQRAYDLAILEWRFEEEDPDYHFDLFHRSNAAAGDNIPGVQNTSLDLAIEDSRRALDPSARQQAVYRVQKVVSDVRPYEVLYYRTNVEGYRQDRFVNWTVRSGTIWNYWSLQGIRPPSGRSLRVSVATVSAMAAGTSESVSVNVRGFEGEALAGAQVNLSVGAGWDRGTLTLGAQSGPSVSGATDLTGQLMATYTAADVLSETHVVLRASVTHPDYPDPVSANAQVAVFPPNVAFLSLRLELPLGDRVWGGARLPLQVEVRDDEHFIVPDADVTATTSDLSSLRPAPDHGSASNMSHISLKASDVTSESTVTVTILAERVGYAPATAGVIVTVIPFDSECLILLDTMPPGLVLNYTDGRVSAPSPQVVGGTIYVFSHWSDGGAQTHTVGCGSFIAYFDAYPLAAVVGLPILACVAIAAFLFCRRRSRRGARASGGLDETSGDKP